MGKNEKLLECPFTWGIDENLAREFDENEEIPVEFEEQPVLALINSLSIAYFLAIQKKHSDALKKTKKSLKILKKIDERTTKKDGISYDVLSHITKATAHHVYALANVPPETLTILDELTDSKKFRSKLEIGTIYGCKAAVWSCFHEDGCQKVVPLARTAVSNSPSSSLWYYILGKALRHVRRNIDVYDKPSEEEMACLKKSYELSPIAFYGIHVAQMYREKEDKERCKKIYLAIYESKPMEIGVNFRLARAFTTFKDLDKAEECLERAGKQNPENSMYLHYKGCLRRKQKRLEEAAYFLKEAASKGNYRADFDYGEVMAQMRKGRFDYVGHLGSMLQRHNRFKQTIHLHMAMQFYMKKDDLENALKNLLKAIQIDPNNKQLKNFQNNTINWNEYLDIFDLVSNTLVPLYTSQRQTMSVEMQDVLTKLQDLCEKQRALEKELTVSLKNMNL